MRRGLIFILLLSAAGCPNEGPSPSPSPGPGPQPGPWVDPHFVDCASYDQTHCGQAQPQGNKVCQVDAAGNCTELARANCSDYDEFDCANVKPASGRACERRPYASVCSDARDSCTEYESYECESAHPQSGVSCAPNWFTKKCGNAATKEKCEEFTDAQCALAMLKDGSVCEIFANGICSRSLRRCEDYSTDNCPEAQPTNGMRCQVSGANCLEIPGSLRPRYYRTADGRRLERRTPFVMPSPLPYEEQRFVHCLEQTSQFFRNDDEVAQITVDLSLPLPADRWVYRYERRTFGIQKVDQYPPFWPISPVNGVERASFGSPFPPKSANGVGATANGLGMYTAWDITASMAYGDDTASTYGNAEIFLLEMLLPAGTLFYSSSNQIPVAGGGTKPAWQLAQQMGLHQVLIENCAGPVAIDSTVSPGSWVIPRDPTVRESVEFTGKNIPRATLAPQICAAVKNGYSASRKAVGNYLLTRANMFAQPPIQCP